MEFSQNKSLMARNNILSSQETTEQKLLKADGIPCCAVKYANKLFSYCRIAEAYSHTPFSLFRTHAPEIFIPQRDYQLVRRISKQKTMLMQNVLDL